MSSGREATEELVREAAARLVHDKAADEASQQRGGVVKDGGDDAGGEEEDNSVYELTSSEEEEEESEGDSEYEADLAEMVDFQGFGGDELDSSSSTPTRRDSTRTKESEEKERQRAKEVRAASNAAALKAQRSVEAAIASAAAAGEAVSNAAAKRQLSGSAEPPIPLSLSRQQSESPRKAPPPLKLSQPLALDRTMALGRARSGSIPRALSPPPSTPPPPLLSPKGTDRDSGERKTKDKKSESSGKGSGRGSGRDRSKEREKGRDRSRGKARDNGSDKESSVGRSPRKSRRTPSEPALRSDERERRRDTRKREKDRSERDKEKEKEREKGGKDKDTENDTKRPTRGKGRKKGRSRDHDAEGEGEEVVLRCESPSASRAHLRNTRSKVASTNTMMLDFRQEFMQLLKEPGELCLFKDFVAAIPGQEVLLRFWSECERYLVLEDCTDAVASGTVAMKICENYGKEELLPTSLRRCLKAGAKSKRPSEAQSIVKDCSEGAFEALLSQSYPNFRLTTLSGRVRNRRASINVGVNLADPFEAPDCRDNVRFEGEVLVAASVPKLIQRLTADVNDPEFTYEFILTHRYFLRSSGELLSLLTKRFNFVSLQGGPDCTQRKTRIMLRTVNVIKLWIDGHKQTFRDEPTLQTAVRSFADQLVEPTLPTAAKNLRDYLANKLENVEEEDSEMFQFSQKAPKPKKPKGVKAGVPLSLEQVKPLELARQMALLDYRLFRAIHATELLQQSWTRPDSKYQRSPHVLEMIAQFNRVGHWAISEVITKVDPERRTKTLMRLIKVASECLHLGNLNGAMALFSSLKNSNVSRLRKTWSSMSSSAWDQWEELDAVLRVDDNFGALRVYMKEQLPPTIPYLGMYLSDLTFVDSDGTFLAEDDTLVNFSKLRKISSLISTISKQQLTPFNLEPLPSVQAFLKELPSLPEAEFYEHSLACEARRATMSASSVSSGHAQVFRSATDDSAAEEKDRSGKILRKRTSSPTINRKLVGTTLSPPSSPRRGRSRKKESASLSPIPAGLQSKRRLSFLMSGSSKRNSPARSSSLSHVSIDESK